MKTLFWYIAPLLALALTLGVGCDSSEKVEKSTPPPGQTMQKRGTAQSQEGLPDSPGNIPFIGDVALEKAAVAHLKIQEIDQELQQSIEQTQDPEERQELLADANQRKIEAAGSVGLDYETYKTIMGQIHMNEGLNERFQEKIQSVGK